MSETPSSAADNVLNQRSKDEHSQLHRLELSSLIEATTLILLVGIAMPLKYWFGLPQATKIMGSVHGIAFLYYCWTVVQTVSVGGWRAMEVVRLIVVAFVPVAGFLNIAWIRRRQGEILRQEPSS